LDFLFGLLFCLANEVAEKPHAQVVQRVHRRNSVLHAPHHALLGDANLDGGDWLVVIFALAQSKSRAGRHDVKVDSVTLPSDSQTHEPRRETRPEISLRLFWLSEFVVANDFGHITRYSARDV